MHSSPYNTVQYMFISIFWLCFVLIWFFSALKAKKTLSVKSRRRGILSRMAIVAAIIMLFKIPKFREIVRNFQMLFINQITMNVGVVICALGLTLAIWARTHLGKNWGVPMSVKEKPDLITSGPYSYIRHPIYTGMLCGAFGSALVTGLPWLIAFIIFSLYFIYSAMQEEKLMTAEFPDQYPAYKKRTKMLIPFVL